jgi:HEPN domain-containing protein
MYYLLTESFKEEQTKLVEIILAAEPAQSIYFLGSALMSRRIESIFMPDAPSCRYAGHYYLLVLVNNDSNLNAVQDKIENNCRHFIPVTAIVLRTAIWNEWLINNHRFAYTVSSRAVLLHGEPVNKIDLQEPDEATIKAQNEMTYREGNNKVTEFIAGAELYKLRKQNNLAAFMLHQAAEHALHTILTLHTGLYLNTHNIDKLLRYCSMVCYRLPEIFPRNNEENERLFQLLQKAYIHTRYKYDYSINAKDLEVLTGRAERLKRITQELCIV